MKTNITTIQRCNVPGGRRDRSSLGAGNSFGNAGVNDPLFSWGQGMDEEKEPFPAFALAAELIIGSQESGPVIVAIGAHKDATPIMTLLADIALQIRAHNLLYLSDIALKQQMIQRAVARVVPGRGNVN